MANAFWLEPAEDDLNKIYFHIARQSRRPRVAYEIERQIRDLCDEYANLTSQGHVLGTRSENLDDDLRTAIHKRWVILFRSLADTIEVLAVVDGSQDYGQLFRERGEL